MTINDAFGILKGADNAATLYLINTSRADLYNLYKPKIRQSTEKDILGGRFHQGIMGCTDGKMESVCQLRCRENLPDSSRKY